MPVTIDEKFDSPQLGKDHSEIAYLIQGTDDRTVATTTLLTTAPATVTVDGEEQKQSSFAIEAGANADLWEGRVEYSTRGALEPTTGSSSFQFDTGGQSEHITQSLSTVGIYPTVIPSFNGAIGVTDDGIAGVDIQIPTYKFSETHYLADEVVTLAYRGILFALTATVNNAPFKGLNAGECLFLGASGAKRGRGDWEIAFNFAGRPNVTNRTIGDISGINKDGWDYLWVRYEDAEKDFHLVKRPIGVYVERVYPRTNFSLLGI